MFSVRNGHMNEGHGGANTPTRPTGSTEPARPGGATVLVLPECPTVEADNGPTFLLVGVSGRAVDLLVSGARTAMVDYLLGLLDVVALAEVHGGVFGDCDGKPFLAGRVVRLVDEAGQVVAE